MQDTAGTVTELRLDENGGACAAIACPPRMVPAPGRYLAARNPADLYEPLPAALFPREYLPGGFLSAAPIPSSWTPGTRLQLRGPLGAGFDLLPAGSPARRLCLAALGDSAGRLLPLVEPALAQGCALALFTGCPLPSLPAAVEIYPLGELPAALTWADLLLFDLPLERLPDLRSTLALRPGDSLPCPAQALVFAPYPCAGVGVCGACAAPARRGWKLTCRDGPVLDLGALDW